MKRYVNARPGDPVLKGATAWLEQVKGLTGTPKKYENGVFIIPHEAPLAMWAGGPNADYIQSANPRVRTGDVVLVREPWVLPGDDDAHVRSARTMPVHLITRQLTVLSVEPVWLPDLTEAQALECGFEQHVPNGLHHSEVPDGALMARFWWEKRYPKHPWESWAWKILGERQ